MLNYFSWLNIMPPQIAVMIISMVPFAENRLAVPVALGVYHLPIWQALFFSIIGSIVASTIIIFGLDFLYYRLRGHLGFMDGIIQRIFDRTEQKFMHKYERWGELALLLFVAAPLPMTGAWTGSIAAFLFGVKPLRALLFISLGVILSAGTVAFLSLGIINFI